MSHHYWHRGITGGTGGLGRTIANGLAAAGATVVVADIVLDQADEIVAEIESYGRSGLPCRLMSPTPVRSRPSPTTWCLSLAGLIFWSIVTA